MSKSITTVFHVSGVDCPDEVKAIQASLSISGIESVDVNIMTGSVKVTHSNSMNLGKIRQKIEVSGVKVKEPGKEESIHISRSRVILILTSGLLLLLGFALEYLLSQEGLAIVIYTISAVSGGALVFPKALQSMRRLNLDMNVLMTVAVIGAFFLKEFSEAATVIFLFSFSEFLESYSVIRARKAIKEVLDIAPKKARVKTESGWVEKELNEIKINDTIQVVAGERIALDGMVIEGNASVNQAPLTGESIPLEKKPGLEVYAGSLCENGSMEVKVSKIFSDTRLSKIINLVEEAQATKAPSQRFVDRFARIYTPVVFMLAVAVYLIPVFILSKPSDLWLYRALVLLVIACPCALVISTPISIVSALTALAKNGVLIKGGSFLEALGKIRVLAVDKTGTLTEGRPRVVKVVPWGISSEEKILEVAAAIESQSTHPLAKAIMDFSKQKNISVRKAINFELIQGKGVGAIIDNHEYFLGNHKFAHDLGVCSKELEAKLHEIESQTYSLAVVGHKTHAGCPGEVLGIIVMGDELRVGVRDVVMEIKKLGITKVIMLSGDNQKTAESIGVRAGVDEVYGDLLPEQKVEKLKDIVSRHKSVAMVGDGINDAPALALASVGIAMGGGTDTAIETADVTLMKDDLTALVKAVSHAKKTLNIIKFNISFSLLTKLVFLGLAVFGFSNLWLAVAADTGASLLVSLNSLRLLKAPE